jgi:hypothetical protein
MNKRIRSDRREVQFVPKAFVGEGGQFAAPLRPRFAPIVADIGLARDAQICSQIASPSSRDLVKYPG